MGGPREFNKSPWHRAALRTMSECSNHMLKRPWPRTTPPCCHSDGDFGLLTTLGPTPHVTAVCVSIQILTVGTVNSVSILCFYSEIEHRVTYLHGGS